MNIYVLKAEKGNFLNREGKIKRLDEATDYFLFSESKAGAADIAKMYVCDRLGHGAAIESHAIFDDAKSCIQRADSNDHLSLISDYIAESSRFLGSVKVENCIVISPMSSHDTLVVAAVEADKKRVLMENIYFRDGGSLEWGDEMKPFNIISIVKAIQNLF